MGATQPEIDLTLLGLPVTEEVAERLCVGLEETAADAPSPKKRRLPHPGASGRKRPPKASSGERSKKKSSRKKR